MTLKIQHKRSAVKAKAPQPTDLEYGEIAVNYESSDPCIYIKDSANNVRRIGAQSGVLVFKGTVAPTSTAPAAPATGSVYIMNAAGVMAASWTGMAGKTVTQNENIAWTGSQWESLGGSSTPWTRTGTVLSPANAGDDVSISSGKLLVGTSTAPYTAMAVFRGHSSGAPNQGIIHLQKGTANPTVADQLGEIKFSDSNGSIGAEISAYNDLAWATNDYPTRLVFTTTASGASSPTERMRIESNGKVELFGSIYGQERTITSSFDLNTGNFWTCGAIAIPNPTNAVAGMSGLIRLTAAPTGWGGNFSTAPTPTVFPSIVPFYVESATKIRLGSAVGVA